MIGRLRRGWAWFVEGLTEALQGGIDRAGRRRPLRMEIGRDEAVLLGANGSRIGSLAAGQEGGFRFEPPDLVRTLAGASIDVGIPPAWLFRRDLDPVAVQSRPFLDAFVRHQIERITPWRVADAYYQILERALPGDAARIGVAVAVVPKRLVAAWLPALEALRPRSIHLRSIGDADRDGVAIPIGSDRAPQAERLRRLVVTSLAVAGGVTLGLVAWLQWQATLVQSDIDEQDLVLAERKAVLTRALRRDKPGGDAEAKLRLLRQGRPLAVGIIDALSLAVPDSAHLSALSIDKDQVTISGISTDLSSLVPSLESSGRFADVAFSAATTRVESGTGDRFSLTMKVVPQKDATAEAPPRTSPLAADATR